jgi:hypothetical protein
MKNDPQYKTMKSLIKPLPTQKPIEPQKTVHDVKRIKIMGTDDTFYIKDLIAALEQANKEFEYNRDSYICIDQECYYDDSGTNELYAYIGITVSNKSYIKRRMYEI